MSLLYTAFCGLSSLLCFTIAARLWRREQSISGTPRSRIGSAAQGYVVLLGNGHPRAGHSITAPFSGKPCVWWATQVDWIVAPSGDAEQRMFPNPEAFERQSSSELFVLDDGSGECLVDPAFATVQPKTEQKWYANLRDGGLRRRTDGSMRFGDDLCYTEWRIEPRETITARGYFRTVDGVAEAQQLDDTVRAILAGWKQDQAALIARFDKDGDGKVDEREWEEARREARLEAMHNISGTARPAMNTLCEPSDGRELVLSIGSPRETAPELRLLVLAMLFLGVSAGILVVTGTFNP